MKTVKHPNVIQLSHIIEITENIYLVMEYAGGGQLLQYLPEVIGMQEEVHRVLG